MIAAISSRAAMAALVGPVTQRSVAQKLTRAAQAIHLRSRPATVSQRRAVTSNAAADEENRIPLTALEVNKFYPGTVTSFAAFGAFVDIGAERSGLVHVSQLSTAFVRSPSDVLEVGQEIECRVVSVDAERGRFSLSLLREGEKEAALERRRSERL